jgi:hypothetical protein
MKVGDMVKLRKLDRFWFDGRCGITVKVDDSHRQTKVDVLFADGLKIGIWEGYLEVING